MGIAGGRGGGWCRAKASFGPKCAALSGTSLAPRLLDKLCDTSRRGPQHGEVLHPHQFAEKLQVAPYCYFIKPWESPHRFDDALFDTTYLGGTALLIVNVPHGLTEEDLRAWFRAGLVGGDVEVIEITKKIQRTGESRKTRVVLGC